MSDNTTRYLLYASLLLGSIGTYNAVKDSLTRSLDSEDSISAALSTGDLSSADVVTMMTQLSRKVDENTAAKAANSTTISVVAADTDTLRSDVNIFADSISEMETFLDSYNSKSTGVHAQLSEIEAMVTSLVQSDRQQQDGSPVEVDSNYVTKLSNRVVLLETTTTTSKEAAFSARDYAETNKAALAKLKSSVETLTNEFSSAKIASGQVAQLAEQVQSTSPAASAITAMTTRLNGLTAESQGVSERVAGLESWRASKLAETQSVGLDSSPAELTEAVLIRLADAELVSDGNSGKLLTLRSDVDVNTDDIAVFSVDLQGQISLNKSAISAVDLKADTTIDNVTNILNPRLDAVETDIIALEEVNVSVNTRVSNLEDAVPLATAERGIIAEDVTTVAERVTDTQANLNDLTDDIEHVVKQGIQSNADNIDALLQDAAELSDKLTISGEDLLCNAKLRANHGAEISLNGNYIRLLSSTDDAFMVYSGDGSAAEGPSGNSPAKGYGFGGKAARIRTAKASNNGFIVENTQEETLLSVRGSDGLTACAGGLEVNNYAHVFADGTGACFGHANVSTIADCALAHLQNGRTILSSSGDDAELSFEVKGKQAMSATEHGVLVQKTLKVDNAGSAVHTTFDANANIIAVDTGKKTFFRFGSAAASVHVREKEVQINGLDVYAKLVSLQKQIDDLDRDSSNCVKLNREDYYINGHKDNSSAQLSYSGDDARWSKSNTRMKIRFVEA
ncbi:unnamed protein product [Ectocarpus sp. 6 AP-2014]